MAKLKLISTIFSKLGSLTKNNGQIIVTRDSKSLYVDLESERIEITNWIDIDTEESLLAILTPLTNKYYYTKDSNKIWRYIGGEWICVNVNVNELTPTYAESTSLVKLSSGEKLSVAFGKISKAITDLISHIGDSTKHITSTERTNWNSAKTHADSAHAPADAQKNVQSDWSATSGDAYIKNKPTEFPPSIHTHTKSEISDFPSSLPASGGNSDTVNNHTVETDVPVDAVFTDTIYDDTEVKESIAELNSNLDNLAYGENGVHNLLNPTLQSTTKNGITCTNNGDGTYTFNGTVDSGAYPEFYLGMITLDKGEYLFTNQDSTIYLWCGTSKGNDDIINRPLIGGTFINIKNKSDIYISLVCSSGETYHNVVIKPMITEDLTATYDDFVPYIPSVKMLAEEVSAQNDSLSDYGLDNKSSDDWKQGYYDENLNVASSNGHLCIGTYPCNSGDLINIKTSKDYKQITIRYNNGSIGGDGTIGTPHNKISVTVPSGATSFGIYVGNDVPITTSDGGHISVYVNNEIEQLKNDLIEIHDFEIGANFSGVAKYMKIGKMICCHINIICTSDVAPYGDIVSNFPSPISDVTYYKENGIQIFVSKNNTWSTCSSTIPKDRRIESYISYIAQ